MELKQGQGHDKTNIKTNKEVKVKAKVKFNEDEKDEESEENEVKVKVMVNPSLTWSERRKLVKLAKSAADGNQRAKDQVWGDHRARTAVADRFQHLLLLFFCCSIVFFFLSANLLLSERVSRGAALIWIRIAHGCEPSNILRDNREEECVRLFYQTLDRYVLLFGFATVVSLVTIPLNGTVLVLLCRRDYSRNVWFSWLLVHYLLIFVLILTLVLMPLALGLYWVVQAMKQYATTFEVNIPLA